MQVVGQTPTVVYLCSHCCALIFLVRAMAGLILNLTALSIAEWVRDPKYDGMFLAL